MRRTRPVAGRRCLAPWAAVCITCLVVAPAPAHQATGQPKTGGPATCVGECHGDITGRKHMHGPVQSDCGVCHVQTGDPKDHSFSFIVARDQICARCHVLPHEEVMHLPVREGRCLECHDPHGSDHPRSLLADPKKDLCLRCHKQDFASMKFQHGPVAVGACVVCHRPHASKFPGLLAQDARTLCQTCHAEVQTEAGPGVHIHAAVEQGCVHCHDPHASNHRFQLRQAAPGLCLSCHQERFEQMTKDAAVVHGAVTEEGGCSVCHEPHSSRFAFLRRGAEPDTCLACHDRPLKTADGASVTDMAALLSANPDRHGPIRQGACTACHDPHAGKNFRMLTEEYPPQFYAPFTMDTFKLCFRCHIPDLVLKPSGRHITEFRHGDQNLHWLHVNQEKGRTCRACHEVHASKRPAHIREAVPFGSSGWMLEINFEKTVDGGTCSPGCHTARRYDRKAVTPAAVKPPARATP